MEISAGVPKLVRVQGRNLPFDALARACDIDTRNPRQARILGTALKEIRTYFYGEVGVPEEVTPQEWEQALARAIEARAQVYRVRFKNAELTPIALAKWWHQLARQSTAGGRVESQLHRAVIDEMHQLYGRKE